MENQDLEETPLQYCLCSFTSSKSKPCRSPRLTAIFPSLRHWFTSPTELLLHLSWTPWAKSPARQEGGERKEECEEASSQKASSFSFPHILRLPHSTTTITTETHCIWDLSCHIKILKCEWSPRSLSVCACSCVWSQDLVSPSVSQSNLPSDAWCKHRVMRKDRGRQMFTVAMRFCLKWCILTWKELRIKH